MAIHLAPLATSSCDIIWSDSPFEMMNRGSVMDGIECRSYSSPVNGTTSRHQARFAYKGGEENKSAENISQLRRENSERAFAGCHICARAVSGRSAAQQTAAAERSAGGYAAFRALSAGGRLSYHNKKTHRIHTLYSGSKVLRHRHRRWHPAPRRHDRAKLLLVGDVSSTSGQPWQRRARRIQHLMKGAPLRQRRHRR